MAVFVLSLNRSDQIREVEFARRLADELERLGIRVKFVNCSGAQLLCGKLIDNSYDVIVVVSHGGSEPPATPLGGRGRATIQTHLADGCTPEHIAAQLDSPDVLMQLLEGNPTPYVLVYCVCEADSIDTHAATFSDPQCLGVVASECKVWTSQLPAVVDLVSEAHAAVASGHTDVNELYDTVAKVVKRHGGKPPFRYKPAIRIEEGG